MPSSCFFLHLYLPKLNSLEQNDIIHFTRSDPVFYPVSRSVYRSLSCGEIFNLSLFFFLSHSFFLSLSLSFFLSLSLYLSFFISFSIYLSVSLSLSITIFLVVRSWIYVLDQWFYHRVVLYINYIYIQYLSMGFTQRLITLKNDNMINCI